MQAIQKCSVCSHFRREWVKQAGGFQQHIYALVDVAHKDHRGRGCFFLLATGKGPGCHIVLHDLDAVFVLELDTSNLIKSHTVPKSHQTNGLSSHVVEQVCHSRLSTGHQNAVGADLLIDMGFTGAARTKLTEVEVVLHQRQHTCQQEPFLPLVQLLRLITARAQHDIHPLVLREGFTPGAYFLNIDMRHLDGGQLANADRRNILLLFLPGFAVKIFHTKAAVTFGFIFQLNDAPDAAAEQTVIFFRVVVRNGHIGEPQIGKLCKEAVFLDIQMHGHHINNGVAAVPAQLRKHLLRLIRAHKVVRQNMLYVLHTLLDDFLIVRAAILPQQKLQHIDRYVGTFLDLFGQILTDDTTIKVFPQFPAQFFPVSLCCLIHH